MYKKGYCMYEHSKHELYIHIYSVYTIHIYIEFNVLNVGTFESTSVSRGSTCVVMLPRQTIFRRLIKPQFLFTQSFRY